MDMLEACIDLDMAGFAERLHLARRRSGLSQEGLCALADLAPTHYSGIETGQKAGLRVQTLYKLCRVLRVSADYLLGLPASRGPSHD